ncbi:4,4'-diaponeurosporenoate glycosyltransferase [Caprobacter fermentans]|uniref:4,4'-diaponeurosporenoate glycosyltransferase n=1 Tax=Caproicibacter fermentans TaxID=2576756 RepID=A0A6N8HVW2_9FIRM|nr:glycosyltransferase [Caproicibacter fermentans]MVB09944.1 4,4'-diaponeurosporenoate glycosyltransferase [Caproicibacter fermentans]
MPVFLLLFLECFTGFVLYARMRLPISSSPFDRTVSVIIPARNEERNLPLLLESLQRQTRRADEVLVIDDFSSDRTADVAERFGATVVHSAPLPEHWTGKNWAVWNGYLKSTGEILVFLDADVRLAPDALKSLLAQRERSGGVISVVPYHTAEKFYEKLSLVLCLLGIFAFTSPFERKNRTKGLYGSCIVAARKDYQKIHGHSGVKAELLEDINLGKRFCEAGVPVCTYLSNRLVSFRMYPNGIFSELQGFAKGAMPGAATLKPETIALIVCWLVGLICSGAAPVLILLKNPLAVPFAAGYLLYAVQFLYFRKDTGRYGLLMPLLHFISTLFFLVSVLYSLYRLKAKGSFTWKGRDIPVGRGRDG